MDCPSCSAAMTAMTLDGRLGAKVDIDLCTPCQTIWFDQFESLRLSPGAILQLFRLIGDDNQAEHHTYPDRMTCPRCGGALVLTHDRQRNTPFQYWRCDQQHGRLITFLDFLREKDFIRPLSPQQIAEVRQNVQTINCASCGAPIDLAHDTACGHCGAPISMIDMKQVAQMAAELQKADASAKAVDPMLPMNLALQKSEVDAMFASINGDPKWDPPASFSLLQAGLRAIGSLLK